MATNATHCPATVNPTLTPSSFNSHLALAAKHAYAEPYQLSSHTNQCYLFWRAQVLGARREKRMDLIQKTIDEIKKFRCASYRCARGTYGKYSISLYLEPDYYPQKSSPVCEDINWNWKVECYVKEENIFRWITFGKYEDAEKYFEELKKKYDLEEVRDEGEENREEN